MADTQDSARRQAVMLVVTACFLLAGMDALGKQLVQHLPAAQVVWARYTFHTLLVGLLFGIWHRGGGFLRPQRFWLQLLRGLCLLGVTFGMYLALRTVSLGEATAIMFLAPILVTLLAAWLLREPIRPVHLAALALGFTGVTIILHPGMGIFQPALLLPLGSAVLLAVYFILTRHLRGKDSAPTTLFHTTVAGSIVLSIAAPLFWVAPTPHEWPLLVLMGGLGATGHLLLIRAFHLCQASRLSPWLNMQILAAALYSAALFGDALSLPFAIGAILIVLGGILVWRTQERHESTSDTDRP
jgi:drug/metabolite transporter (DMT)-like permease